MHVTTAGRSCGAWQSAPVHTASFGSLDGNQLCGFNFHGEGTYTAEGITKISEMLKANTTLTSIRHAATPSLFGMLPPKARRNTST
jgi:hypothetical protein